MSDYITCPHCGDIQITHRRFNRLDDGDLERRGGECMSCKLNVNDAPKRPPPRLTVVDPIDRRMSDDECNDSALADIRSKGAR